MCSGHRTLLHRTRPGTDSEPDNDCLQSLFQLQSVVFNEDFLGVGNTEGAAGLGKRVRREVLGVLKVGLWRGVQLETQVDGRWAGRPGESPA